MIKKDFKETVADIYKAAKKLDSYALTHIVAFAKIKNRQGWFCLIDHEIYEAIPLYDINLDQIELYKIANIINSRLVINQEVERALVRLPNLTAIYVEGWDDDLYLLNQKTLEYGLQKMLETELESDINKLIVRGE